jgi:hypothetical protein
MMANRNPDLRYWIGIVLALMSLVFLWPAIVVAAVMTIPLLICLFMMAALLELIRYT